MKNPTCPLCNLEVEWSKENHVWECPEHGLTGDDVEYDSTDAEYETKIDTQTMEETSDESEIL